MKQRQAMMAGQFAMGKERFHYYAVFYSIVMTFLPIGAFKTHNPKMLIPLVPMTFTFLFQYDMFYGNMQIRA